MHTYPGIIVGAQFLCPYNFYCMSGLNAIKVGKTFSGTVALDKVSLQVQRGMIHALVGANGAGKSTLIKILTGFYAEYEGTIEIDDERVQIVKPADALGRGIEVVHQEVDTTLIPYLTVAENLLIEQLAEPKHSPWLNWRVMYDEARTIAARVGLTVDARREVQDLTLHEKQLLVIARAISRKVSFLILDEPTASLSINQVERLFQVLRELMRQNIGVLYISHRLGEVRELANEITVLRNGRAVAHFHDEFDLNAVIEAMLGTPLADAFPPRVEHTPGEIVLQATDLTRQDHVNAVSLTVRRGEILGVAGLVGAGKTELLRLLYGADKKDAGEIRVDGALVEFKQPHDAVEYGIVLVPEERRKQGLLIQESVRSNVTLPYLQALTWFQWVLPRRELEYTRNIIARVGLVPPQPEMTVGNLSGGNQQKVVLGKWLGQPAKVMLFDEATQGIDLQAKREVYALVQECSQTAGVIFASSDIDEVLALADEIIVMRDGAVVARVRAQETTRQALLEWATGAPAGVGADA